MKQELGADKQKNWQKEGSAERNRSFLLFRKEKFLLVIVKIIHLKVFALVYQVLHCFYVAFLSLLKLIRFSHVNLARKCIMLLKA